MVSLSDMENDDDIRGPGRPPLPPELRRERRILFMRGADWAKLVELARKAGCSPGQVVAWFAASEEAAAARKQAIRRAPFWGYGDF